MEELLNGFSVVIPIAVAWGEMDAFGHVNNVVYFRYFESARIAYFERIQMLDYMQAVGVGPIVASLQCRFRAPLTYPDKLSVGVRAHSLEADRFMMDYCVVSQKLAKVAAEGSGLVVMYDYKARSKAPMPELLRERILALESASS
ncbi:MAG: acyl-CoA thioesterase [Candidatus Thermofonsia Clade 1 bacterium]|jgi:acyl-CoA thioester hydrolase|uniref:Acyl-CoA thioesterase n=1 Tax=Candidatus Thermofonsia Clade 1 bacterium TaxID=2364210 RepID=A0A2M8PG38_9CHLR|nr:MAG: acyl-CoA thioesterase [Candidatus Thermofonsia Clade 1 bacterium]